MTATAIARTRLDAPVWSIIVFVLAGGTALHVWLHFRTHGVVNVHQLALAFFLVLNVLINFWEMGLWFRARDIADEYEAARVAYRGREMQRAAEFFALRVPLGRWLSFSSWTGVWSTYALFDPGYADKRSLGFNVDVGNGFSTVIPSTIFALGMTFQVMPARVLGIIGIALFWQMFYGTILYFFQFFHNGRHVGHSLRNILLFVVGTNGLWFVFSPWGLAISIALVQTGTYSVLI